MFDLILANGTVIDGTRSARFSADVAVAGDRIAAIGDLGSAESRDRIDVAGKVVAPGFIDVHNHSDGWLLKTPHLVPKTMQGFTTEVLMLDGISYAPVDEMTARHWLFYLRALDGLRIDEYQGWKSLTEFMQHVDGRNVQNAAMHVPYANVRSLACGFGSGGPDDFQMREIVRQIRQGVEEGAVGVSTGLDYIVQCFATTGELVRACAGMQDSSRLYVTHIRYKTGLLPALREAVEIGRRAGVRVHISHLKAHSQRQIDEVLEFVDTVARQEVEFSFDVYPYQPGSTMLSYLLPYEVWNEGPLAVLGRLRRPEFFARFREGLEAYRLKLDQLRIAWTASKEGARWQGMRLSEYIAHRGLPAAEAILDLLLEERLAVLLVFDEGDDRLVHPFLSHDLYMMGSDGIYCDDGCVHPRVYGSATRLLGPLVRDKRLFSLEEAVYKLSGFAAERFGMKDRGVLEEGAFADVVVFDPESVCDRATYESPRQLSTGIETVLINGTPVITDGSPAEDLAEPLPGRFLKFEV